MRLLSPSTRRDMGLLEVNDFLPISLVSGVYKIILKVLAKLLNMVMEQIIFKLQNAFVQGRQILIRFSLPINA